MGKVRVIISRVIASLEEKLNVFGSQLNMENKQT